MTRKLNRREFMEVGSLFVAGAATLLSAGPARSQETSPVPSGVYQTLKDPKIISELEMKHVPLIEAPARVRKGESFDLKVRIGRVLHPMEMPHHIEWIHLFKNDRPLAEIELSLEGLNPVATVNLSLTESAKIDVKILCNLHGYWMESKTIEV